MIDMDISFGDSPWEAWMDRKRYGDSLSAAQLLTFLEEETEEGVEDAFAALEDRGLKLDVTTLPSRQFVGQAALRLRQEEQMAKENMALQDLGPNDPLRLYLEEIASLPPAEETEELLRQAADGDEKAKEILTGAGLRRVAEIAKEFTGYGVLLMDLIQEGSMGLWKVVSGFSGGDYPSVRDDAIRQAMARAVTLQARESGVGRKMRQALEDYRAVDQRLLAELGRNPTLKEIAQELHMTPEDAATVKRNLDDARILAQATAPKEEAEPEEENQAVEDTAYFQMRQRITELLSVLPEEDARLLSLRFGLDKELPLSPEDTGKRMGLTPQEVVARGGCGPGQTAHRKRIRRRDLWRRKFPLPSTALPGRERAPLPDGWPRRWATGMWIPGLFTAPSPTSWTCGA